MNGAFHAPPLTVPPVFADGQSRRESPKMASRPFQLWEKKHSKIRKRAAKHFEGLVALFTHSAGRRVAVKAGCKPVHFSLDGCPLSCYFSGSVATTSGHFVHKSERRTRDGGFHIRPVCCWNQTCAYGSTPRKHSPVFLPLQMPLPSPAATAFSRQRRQSV